MTATPPSDPSPFATASSRSAASDPASSDPSVASPDTSWSLTGPVVDLTAVGSGYRQDVAVVGGKAATLARLTAAGLPVPPGVVLVADVFRRAVAAAEAHEPATDAFDPAEGAPEPAAPEAAVPEAALSALIDAIAGWGEVALAVRSSAVEEDGQDASYAGLFESVLDVRTRDDLEKAVLTCWRSAFSARVGGYAPGTANTSAQADRKPVPALAVLVQPMVAATAAGVAFTADPVTGAQDQVIIEAVAGLADRLVAGEVDPERWIVAADGTRWAVTSDQSPSTHQSPAADQVLSEDQARAVAALAQQVQDLLGPAQDIEWALAGAELLLLQARPITTRPTGTIAPGRPAIEPIPVPVEPPPGFWSRETSHAPQPWRQLSRQALSRRTPSLAAATEELGFLFETLDVRDIGGWEYTRPVPIGGKDAPVMPGWAVRIATWVVPQLRRRIRIGVQARREDRAGQLIRRWDEEFLPALESSIRRLRDVDLAELDDTELAAHLDATMRFTHEGARVHFLLNGVFALLVGDLALTGSELLGWDEMRLFELVSGTSHRSTQPSRALARLADQARRRPELRRAIEGGADVDTVLDLDPQFRSELAVYLEHFGCRALHLEVADSALDERPDLVLALIRDQLATGYDPTQQEEDLRSRREQALTQARAALATRPVADRSRFEQIVTAAVAAYPIREDNEFFTVSAPLALVRRAALESGRRLTARGVIDHRDDVFELETTEQAAALTTGRLPDGGSVRTLIERRLGERAWILAHPGPASYGEKPPEPSFAGLPAEARRTMAAFLWATERVLGNAALASGGRGPGGLVTGTPASSGTYTGPVRIVLDEESFDRIRPGDVLVCPTTSPVWSVVFPSIGALVTDTGGILSHPAIIAREYAIPAVVASRDATTHLRDGQLVTVDGTAGTVQVVS